MFRRRETFKDRLWRYRGAVALVGFLALILLAASVSALRVAGPRLGRPRGAAAQPVRLRQRPGPGGGGGGAIYSIVFDAGSTGSRVHVLQFARDASTGKLLLGPTVFDSVKPGLSSYAGDPAAAAASLRPLVETALRAVPAAARGGTGLTLKATAGLRLLPGSKADEILKAVTSYLAAQPFRLGAVGIMDGAHEGAYAWLTLNYLLGKLDGGPAATVAAIDLGGGSVQEAFALGDAEVAAAPAGYVTQVWAGGSSFNVYVHSYLGYGLMAARARVIESGANGTAPSKGHPCFAKGTKLRYSYGGKEYPVGEVIESGSFQACAAAALKALDHDKDCGGPKGSCSFSGAWRGKPESMRRVYYVSSYFFDRAAEAGIVPKDAIDFEATPAEFARLASSVCGRDPSLVAHDFNLAPDAAPFFCLDLSFCHTVLTQGFDLPASEQLTLVKRLRYRGRVVDASWALGAAIDELSAPRDGGRGGGGTR